MSTPRSTVCAVYMMCLPVSARGLQCFGPTGRWRTQLMNKILAADASYDDVRISPVIRYVRGHTPPLPLSPHDPAHVVHLFT